MIRLFLPAVLFTVLCATSFSQEKKWPPPSPVELSILIGKDNALAADKIRSSYGKEKLAGGTIRGVEETTLLLAVTSDEPVSAFKSDGTRLGDLTKIDDGGLYAFAADIGNCQEFSYDLKSDSGKRLGGGAVKLEFYPSPTESQPNPDIPKGSLYTHEWSDSKIYPDTRREFIVYIPDQYNGTEAAALMVFQDGLRHADINLTGGLRAPLVFDNLIASGDMPVTIGLFINPGSALTQPPGTKPRNRSLEYDSLGDTYVSFLLEEIIPFIIKEHGLKISKDPSQWAIAGGSSGCACAWTAAWERPDKFGKVLGWVGTFVDIRGANAYPSLIRKTEKKPIRAALLGEANDLDNQFGNWPLANHQMETALAFANYDYHYWWGEGFHGSRHAAAMLPEMLKWLWSH
ncbi:MAG: alpha/beta hydrolase-fold protein [Verrucomicrobiales bacterium]|nr:alpha/beta hydrolase-fold protein [Verrucomicrobiales bacterium]